MIRIGIVILNWNGWKDTINCLNSISSQIYSNIYITVIDNKSSDNSIQEILRWAKGNFLPNDLNIVYDANSVNYFNDKIVKKFNLLINNSNLGYAGGNNSGIKLLMRHVDYIWILNNDTELANEAIQQLVSYLQINSDVGILGCTIAEYHNKEVVQCAGGAKYFPFLAYGKYQLRGTNLNELLNSNYCSIRLDYISGASMIVKCELFKQIGLLNEEYFLYFEEIDIANRCKKAGYKINWCKECIVYHKEGGTLGSCNIMKKKSLTSEYYSNLSALKYTRKYHGNILIFVMVLRFILKGIIFLRYGQIRLFTPLIKSYKTFFE